MGTYYRRQLSFALMDLALHTQIHATNAEDMLPLSNQVLSEVSLPMPPDTAFVAYFGHIIGYGAGYYGYAWADAIAADMATVFEQSPDGYSTGTRASACARKFTASAIRGTSTFRLKSSWAVRAPWSRS